MKKIFNTLLITLVTLVSVFAFSIVHAKDKETIVCEYSSNYKVTIAETTKGKIYVKSIEPANIGGVDNTKDVFFNGLTCPKALYFREEVVPQIGNDRYFSSSNKTGYTELSLINGKKDCNEWNDIKSKYDVSSFETRLNEIVAGTNNPNSYIVDRGNSFDIKELNANTTCDQYRAYNQYYFNTLNPTYGDGDTKVSRLSKDIQKMKGKLLEEKVCPNSEYTATITTLTNYQNKVDSFLRAAHYEAEAVKKHLSKMKSEGICDIDPEAFDNYVDNDLSAVDRYKKEAMLVGATFEFKSGCAIIDGDLKDFLNTVLFYIRLVAIILAVVLSLLDYIKAASASDDKPMSAANKRFITRLILVIVLFLLPVLLTFILNVLNINSVTGDSIECLDIDK